MATINFTRLAKELKSHLRRLMKSHEIVELDLLHYFRKTIRNLLYLNTHHPILQTRLLKKRNIIIIRHNSVKYKAVNRLKAKRKKQRDKEFSLTWSKRVVGYLKRQRALLKNIVSTELDFDLQPLPKPALEPQLKLEPEIIRKLNERIKQYKDSTIKSNQLGKSSDIVESTESAALKPVQPNPEDNPQNDFEKTSLSNAILVEKKVDGEKVNNLTGHKFLDSLINKLKSDQVDQPANINNLKSKQALLPTSNESLKENTSNASKTLSRLSEANETLNAIRDDSESSNSSDFCGFADSEPIAGLLPTPVVPNREQSDKSAFVSEQLDAFLRENSLENSAQVELPKSRKIEDGMVCEGAQPPKMTMQPVPEEFAKARTVAEKRILLQKRRSNKYFIIENENTIYRELKRRSNYGRWNENLIKNLQKGDVPFTRDGWKATSWLRTMNGKFCFQTITVDGKNYKLIGTRGNHNKKILGIYRSPQISKRPKKGCPAGCPQQINIKDISSGTSEKLASECHDETDSEVKPKYLRLLSYLEEKQKYKPGPLSKKCQSKQIDNLESGEVGIYEMPSVQLEIFPKVNQPLDEKVKPYLKIILPSEKISREWAEFAVSTLVTKPINGDKNRIEIEKKSFTFNIPYLNQQKNVLVRKIVKRNEKYDHQIGKKLAFLDSVDTENSVELICGNVLSEMIDSVALSLCEDSLVRRDPWIDYSQNKIKDIYTKQEVEKKIQFESEVVAKEGTNETETSRRLLKELKRLNATIVKADSSPDILKCDQEFCQFGCVCQSLTGTKIAKKHCGKADCMFTCSCAGDISAHENESNNQLSKEDAMLLREQATASLAKVEKEFCATLVLTGNTTYLLNESQSERRRPTKVPKRYSDYVQTEVPTSTREAEAEILSAKPQSEVRYNGSAADFKHCNVAVEHIEGLGEIEPWCMVHCLYKCFCKGKAVEGEPFCFDQSTVIEEIEEDPQPPRKRRYSFDQVNYQLSPTTRIKRKYYSRGYVSGTRTSAIPSHIYKRLNREKAKSLNAKIQAEETEEKDTLLKKRIRDSSLSKCNAAIEAKQPTIEKAKANLTTKQPSPSKKPVIATPTKSLNTRNVSPTETGKRSTEALRSADMQKITNNLVNYSNYTKAVEHSPEKQKIISKKVDHTIEKQKVTNKNVEHLAAAKQKISQKNAVHLAETQKTQKRVAHLAEKQKITQKDVVYSADIQHLTQKQAAKSVPIISSVMSLSGNNEGVQSNGKISSEQFHRRTVAMLNIAVTKTMQSISKIQSQDLEQIPNPVPGTLCSTQWRHFLRAFIENRLFVWEVFVKNHKILVATKQNVMPQIPSAISAANIRILPSESLPLIAQMLVDNKYVDDMKTLSILMAGQNNYWRIIGCTKSNMDYTTKQCIVKPTPETHPKVSSKVNELYKLLFVQQMQNILRKSSEAKVEPSKQNKPGVKSLPPKENSGQQVRSISTNLEFKIIGQKDAQSIVIPIPNQKDHLWLMLSLVKDFSHIYIPEWKDFLTYERIQKSFQMAKANNKTVRLATFKGDAHFYSTPHDSSRIYVGPFYEKIKIGFVLCQILDGKIISREDYQKSQNIKHILRSVAYWLQIRNSALVYENLTSDDLKEIRYSKGEHAQKTSPAEAGCSQNVYSLADIETIVEEWCEVHFLYNCFCKGKNVTGEPYDFEDSTGFEEDGETTEPPRKQVKHQISPTTKMQRVQNSAGQIIGRNSSDDSKILAQKVLQASKTAFTPLVIPTPKINRKSIQLHSRSLLKNNVHVSVVKSQLAKNSREKNSSPSSVRAKITDSDQKLIISQKMVDPNVKEKQMAKNGEHMVPVTKTTNKGCSIPFPLTHNAKIVRSPTDSWRIGYFVSNDLSLGKIMGARTEREWLLRIKLSWEWLSFPEEQDLNGYLENLLRLVTKERYNNPLLKWRFIPINHPECDNFRPFSIDDVKVVEIKRRKSVPTLSSASTNVIANRRTNLPIKSLKKTSSPHPLATITKISPKIEIKNSKVTSPEGDHNKLKSSANYPKLVEKTQSYEVILIDD